MTASTKRDARVAGILYLLNGAPARPTSLSRPCWIHVSLALGGIGEGATILWLIIIGATARR